MPVREHSIPTILFSPNLLVWIHCFALRDLGDLCVFAGDKPSSRKVAKAAKTNAKKKKKKITPATSCQLTAASQSFPIYSFRGETDKMLRDSELP